MRQRTTMFCLCCVAILASFSRLLVHATQDAMAQGYSSHILLIPLIVAYLFWDKEAQIFSSIGSSPSRVTQSYVGALVLFGALIATALLPTQYAATAAAVSAESWIAAAFIACFGVGAFRRAAFPLAMLLFMVPIPAAAIDGVIYFLQAQSAILSNWMFSMLGVPVLRDGFVMTVPGATIQVAAECSGINSSIALLILTIIFAHETLQSNWRRLFLIALVIPLSVVKNAIRIVTLTMLATRVDPSFLTGRLHHQGGFVFFLVTFVLMYPIWKLLHRSEGQQREHAAHAGLRSSVTQTGA